jgi:hypothetical protein
MGVPYTLKTLRNSKDPSGFAHSQSWSLQVNLLYAEQEV